MAAERVLTLVTRFAPSPTGYLHLGHARSALEGWEAARREGGRFLLRIEDIDAGRCRPEFTAAILEDMAWLGLDWDGAVRRQSAHFEDYRSALSRLDAMGLLYPCFCTRREILEEVARACGAPQGEEGPVYPGTCRHLDRAQAAARRAAGTAHALRLDLARAMALAGPLDWIEEGVTSAGVGEAAAPRRIAVDPTPLGDVVLARKDIPASYHLAVTVDDALQGVTLVTRGVDLFAATPLHRVLQALLDLPEPRYRHHALLTDMQGRRLAKRDGAMSLRAMRQAGKSPAEIRERAWDQPPISRAGGAIP